MCAKAQVQIFTGGFAIHTAPLLTPQHPPKKPLAAQITFYVTCVIFITTVSSAWQVQRDSFFAQYKDYLECPSGQETINLKTRV